MTMTYEARSLLPATEGGQLWGTLFLGKFGNWVNILTIEKFTSDLTLLCTSVVELDSYLIMDEEE